MKSTRSLLVLAVLAAVLLSACGNKGPLVLPDSPEAAKAQKTDKQEPKPH